MSFEKVRSIIREHTKIDEDAVSLSSNIREDLYADSLDVVDIVMIIQDEFGVEIPDDALMRIITVGDLVAYIDAHL